VHDVWYFNKHLEPPERLEATARKLVKLDFVSVPTEDVQKLVNRINQASNDFDQMAERVIAAPLRLTEESPPVSS
jgi:hypothetical protein